MDTVSEIKRKYGQIRSIEVTFRDNITSTILDVMRLNSGESYKIQSIKPNVVKIGPLQSLDVLVEMIDLFSKYSIQIENIAITPVSLEEIFLKITKTLKDGGYEKNF